MPCLSSIFPPEMVSRFVRTSGLALCFLGVLHGADWPGFRAGPGRSGIFNEPGLPEGVPPAGLSIRWRATLGTGFSGPAIARGRVFVMDRLQGSGDFERILAFDEGTGRPLWTNSYPCALKIGGGYENGPRAVPTVAGNLVFCQGAMGTLSCLDVLTGAVRWRHDYRSEYGSPVPTWGFAAAPLVYRNFVIAQVGSTNGACVVAFDRDTGRERWRAVGDIAGYAAPVVVDVPRNPGNPDSVPASHSGPSIHLFRAPVRPELIVWTAGAIHGLDPNTGAILWHVPRKLAWDQATATPIWDASHRLLICSSDREGTIALRLDGRAGTAETVWDRKTFSLLHGSAVLVGGYVYGLHHNGADRATCGEFRCVEAVSGDLKWATNSVTPLKLHTTAHVAYNSGNGVFYVNNEGGEVILGKCSPTGWVELGRAQIGGKSWSPAAYADKQVFHRAERQLVCAGLLP
jgi:outer membrane protein assembly factor BamB